MALENIALGMPIDRIDGKLKVTGGAKYGSDFAAPRQAFAYLATSNIARGRIAALDLQRARSVPGVIDIFTHENMAGKIKAGKLQAAGGYMGTTIQPLNGPEIFHDGQIIAVVVAESFEAARESAQAIKISYIAASPAATFGDSGLANVAAASASHSHEDPSVGDAEAAYAAAPVKLDAHYSTPTQHHNPIELFGTLCAWDGGKLTVWESSQTVWGYKYGLAAQLAMPAGDIHVISPFIGGAFGSRGSLTTRTAIVAHIAREIGRPVKLTPTRSQGFTIATYRAETEHHIRLGATPDGKLLALSHHGREITSRADSYMVAGTDASTRLYACPNVVSRVDIVHADRNTPGFMRSPPELPYLFALESAMDELAVQLDLDPIELRRRNDTMVEPIKSLPYTSRSLMACFDKGAAAFGWSRRSARPGSMAEGDWLIGWGCASTMYPTAVAPATARVILHQPDSGGMPLVTVQTAAHDIGTGAYTALAMVAAQRLAVPISQISVQLGDSDLPPAPVAGGSNTTASVSNVVAKACDEIRRQLAGAAIAAENGPLQGRRLEEIEFRDGQLAGPDNQSEALSTAFERLGKARLESYAENLPHGVPPDGVRQLYRGVPTLAGGAKLNDRIQFAFGAEFVELRIHRLTREIRCSRLLGAFAAGQIVNAKTAQSQLLGGLIWGLSSALHEATEIDRRAGRYYNADLAEYMIPVNADIGSVEVILVPEEDHLINELGIKGLGELGNVGTNAAVANAVYHATGIRIRDLPIRLEKLFDTNT